MVRGLVAGERYETIARSLKDVFEGDLNKTITIIRTESHRAHETGKAEAVDRATKQGVKMVKVWISSKDERVRDDHISMDGQTVPVDEDFVAPDGSRGPHPGEMGSAAQDINCRCTVAYRVVA
jgi:SPP1 gp7 family putative phage head morphogenesis protein